MPLDIQIPYRGDQYLYQGIAGAGQSVGAGAEQAIKKFKQIQDGGKAADYFMKAGGDQMYEQLGVHPEEWKTLGPRDKMAAVQGLMEARSSQAQMEQMHGLTQERQAKAAELQMRTEEAQAWPAFMKELMSSGATSTGTSNPAEMMSPGASEGGMGPAQAAPTMNLSRENIIAAMSKMGATNPRLASALSRQLIPQMMGQGPQQPQAWKSPEGNPYVMFHNTFMPDKAPTDMSAMMGQAPDGYEAVPTGPNRLQYLKTKKDLPTSFHTTLDAIGGDISSAQATLGQPDTAFKSADEAKTMKGYAQRRLDTAQKRGKATIERYHTAGYISPEEKADYYEQLGLEGPKEATKGPKDQGGNNDLIQQANDAIRKGADPALVKKRLKEKFGIDAK